MSIVAIRTLLAISAGALVASCGTIDGVVGSMYSPTADDSIAALNPNSGVNAVKVNAVVDSGLGVALKVTYFPAPSKRTTLGCFYTTNFIEGAQALRSRVRSFALRQGVNSVQVPVDEILPGICEFEPHMSFEVTDLTNGVKASGGGPAIVLQRTGNQSRPLEIVECRARREILKPDMYCTPEWTRLPTFEARASEAKAFHAPVSTKGGELAVEFRLRGPWGEQTNPSLQTGPAAGGRPAEFQR